MENCNANLTHMDVYMQENAQISDWFLNEYFFKFFHKSMPQEQKMGRGIELVISPKCNLGCKYCYINRYHDKLFPDSCYDEDATIRNLKLICEWMRKNEWNCNLDIFSGEFFGQEIGYRVMDTLYEYYKSVEPDMRCEMITIPTNFTFILSDERTKQIEEILQKFEDLGIIVALSASFDGKYMEQNRPYVRDLDIVFDRNRNDDYYDKAFEFGATHGCGFHPMVYSQGIELWPKNFQWFQDKFKEFDIPWQSLYLLQVRNLEWNKTQVTELRNFIDYLYQFAWEQVGEIPEELIYFIFKDMGFNMLATPYTSCGRGLTCGIQSEYLIRVSDLMCYPCHRTGYKDFYYGQMVEDEEQVLKFVNKNTEMLITTFTDHKEINPYCSQCPINRLCGGTCLGAQYESHKNLLVPIPSVCAVAYAISAQSIINMKKRGMWGMVLDKIDMDKKPQFRYLERNLNL